MSAITNVNEMLRLSVLLKEAMAEARERGFFGEVRVTVKIEDGIIQKTSIVELLSRRR